MKQKFKKMAKERRGVTLIALAISTKCLQH